MDSANNPTASVPTPRTDKAATWPNTEGKSVETDVVLADFARTIERENAALRIERDKAIAQERAQYDVRCAIQQEINEAGFTGCDDEGVRELAQDRAALRSANAELASCLKAAVPFLKEHGEQTVRDLIIVSEAALAAHATQKAPL